MDNQTKLFIITEPLSMPGNEANKRELAQPFRQLGVSKHLR